MASKANQCERQTIQGNDQSKEWSDKEKKLEIYKACRNQTADLSSVSRKSH